MIKWRIPTQRTTLDLRNRFEVHVSFFFGYNFQHQTTRQISGLSALSHSGLSSRLKSDFTKKNKIKKSKSERKRKVEQKNKKREKEHGEIHFLFQNHHLRRRFCWEQRRYSCSWAWGIYINILFAFTAAVFFLVFCVGLGFHLLTLHLTFQFKTVSALFNLWIYLRNRNLNLP